MVWGREQSGVLYIQATLHLIPEEEKPGAGSPGPAGRL